MPSIREVLTAMMLLGVASCSYFDSNYPTFPKIESTYVSPVMGLGFLNKSTYVLLPDGNSVLVDGLTELDLETGQLSIPFSDNDFPAFSDLIRLSPNGRFLSGFITSKGSDNFPVANYYYIDLEKEVYTEFDLPQNGGPAISWSPDGSRFLLAGRRVVGNTEDNSFVSDWNRVVDFTSLGELTGNGQYLWDSGTNFPVAIATYCPILDDFNQVMSIHCELRSISDLAVDGQPPVYESVLEVLPPNRVKALAIDPKGEYILYAVWERTGLPEERFSNDNVVDTVLILVDWRTKESTELFRLSELGDQKVVVNSELQWSSNRSTILVPREDAGAIVIKLRFP